MTFTIEATYENGVLKPAQPLPLAERQRVEVVIRTPQGSGSIQQPGIVERQEALARLCARQLPVADWEIMEDEIIRGAAP